MARGHSARVILPQIQQVMFPNVLLSLPWKLRVFPGLGPGGACAAPVKSYSGAYPERRSPHFGLAPGGRPPALSKAPQIPIAYADLSGGRCAIPARKQVRRTINGVIPAGADRDVRAPRVAAEAWRIDCDPISNGTRSCPLATSTAWKWGAGVAFRDGLLNRGRRAHPWCRRCTWRPLARCPARRSADTRPAGHRDGPARRVPARELLRQAARGFGGHEELARARSIVAKAEIALATPKLRGPSRTLAAAAATLDAPADRASAQHARLIDLRRMLLLGRIDEAASPWPAWAPWPSQRRCSRWPSSPRPKSRCTPRTPRKRAPRSVVLARRRRRARVPARIAEVVEA